jgi:hypothetical protein
MADRHEDSNKGKAASLHPTDPTNLQSTIDLPELDTPNTASSFRFSLRNFTPRLSTTNKKMGNATDPQTPAMNPPQSGFDPWTPSPDIHNKPEPESSRKSKTTRAIGIARAMDAAKRLNRVMGLAPPEPFVTPPDMPKNLEQEFAAGLVEYGLDNRMKSMGLSVLSQAADMQERLPEIMEENESPVEAEWTPSPSGEGADDSGPSISAASAGMSDVEFGALMDESPQGHDNADQQAFASSPPRMPAQGHDPEATASGSSDTHDLEGATLLDGSRPYDSPSFTSFREQMNAFEVKHVPAHSQDSGQLSSDILIGAPNQALKYGTTPGDTSGCGNAFGPARKPLLPSPRVEAQSWDEGKGKGKQPMLPAQATTPPPGVAFFETLFRQPPPAEAPRIAVQAPSPTESPTPKKPSRKRTRKRNKKRKPPPADDDQLGPALKGSRPDEKKATGLPILPASSSWEIDFPGYTPALLTILLNWSFTVQSFYRRLPSPKAFRCHPSFPFPVTAPLYNHLISVGFYDTSVVPHKEIRFLGPGDAAEIGYAEVDVFRSKEARAAFEKQEQESTKLNEMKKKLRLGLGYVEPGVKASRSQDQMHLEKSGEGRWAYVLIKGHKTSKEETAPPHVMLAWHISAVTDTSSCLHTIFPDGHVPTPSHPSAALTPPKPSLRRFASLQNLVSGSCGQKHLHREIRSASSSSELPQVNASSIDPQEGAHTFKRTVVKLDKAGSLPLIEGYRVDVGEFKGWLDAVGRGAGKLIVWRE